MDLYNRVADIASSLQLTGLLFEGKFKELGVSLGLGLVSSALSTAADGIIRGVRGALTKGGKFSFRNFTFKGFFGGAVQGLKRGLSDVFGRGLESLIPIYGRYCGPGLGNGGGGANGAPVDGMMRCAISTMKITELGATGWTRIETYSRGCSRRCRGCASETSLLPGDLQAATPIASSPSRPSAA